jgi:hypothetical protein
MRMVFCAIVSMIFLASSAHSEMSSDAEYSLRKLARQLGKKATDGSYCGAESSVTNAETLMTDYADKCNASTEQRDAIMHNFQQAVTNRMKQIKTSGGADAMLIKSA